jgi:1-pyrroline-5-carboxylate dehydrogenase
MQINGIPEIPKPKNAFVPTFAQGTPERQLLIETLQALRAQDPQSVRLPLIIGGERIESDRWKPCCIPHDHKRILGSYALAGEEEVALAVKSVLSFRQKWIEIPWYLRLDIFRKAAWLLEKKYFFRLVAAVMEDYSKNPYEAAIDVCELIDFWNFNAYYAYQIYREQPDTIPGYFNFTDWRPLEGFVAAIPPNNFISIAGNLVSAPLIMGNVVVVKPSSDTVFSFHIVLEILYEAGLPPETLSVIQGSSRMIGYTLLDHPQLAGVHFTGSTETFNWIVGRIGMNTAKKVYLQYPHRATVGETGGKDFLIVYDDDDPEKVVSATIVGGFGCQGRKCSATSRIYISQEMWRRVKPILLKDMALIQVGDVANFRNFLGAIINEQEYQKIVKYIEEARQDSGVNVIDGSYTDDGAWLVRPTVIEVDNPAYKTMREEIFGPVVTVCVLDENNFSRVLEFCDATSHYGLTGAVNTKNVFTLSQALEALRFSAGNIYDWKTTGAVVGQQPFGGARGSGTDDKAGSKLNLYRWTTPRTISLCHNPPVALDKFMPPYLDLFKSE